MLPILHHKCSCIPHVVKLIKFSLSIFSWCFLLNVKSPSVLDEGTFVLKVYLPNVANSRNDACHNVQVQAGKSVAQVSNLRFPPSILVRYIPSPRLSVNILCVYVCCIIFIFMQISLFHLPINLWLTSRSLISCVLCSSIPFICPGSCSPSSSPTTELAKVSCPFAGQRRMDILDRGRHHALRWRDRHGT